MKKGSSGVASVSSSRPSRAATESSSRAVEATEAAGEVAVGVAQPEDTRGGNLSCSSCSLRGTYTQAEKKLKMREMLISMVDW